MVALDTEIGSAIQIDKIGMVRFLTGNDEVHLHEFEIYMGYCASDELGTNFEQNYIPGSKQLVYSMADGWIYANGVGEWFDLQLDTSFWYNGTDNLLIDFIWTWGEEDIYVYAWDSGSPRSMLGGAASTTGNTDTVVLHMTLEGSLNLESSTFARIKALFI